MKEIRISLQPKQITFKNTIERTPVIFFGGAKGGGKSAGLRRIMLIRRVQYNASSGAIFRRTYPELEGNHIRPLFAEYPQLREYWNEAKKLLTLPNQSTLQFCHAENEKDIDLYQGREFHDLAIDEAGQWSEAMFWKLRGSNRSSIKGVPSRTILTGNPGGPGHKWLKRLFVERRFKGKERPGDYAFIQALVHDNPALIDNDPNYINRLECEPNEALRKAYLHGSWDIFAGQYFSEIDREKHLVKPFEIPVHWNRFGSYDYGFNHPAAFGWFAVDEDGQVFQYREFVKAGLRVDQFAAEILKYADTKELMYIRAGWDCWAKKAVLQTGTSPTIAEEFQRQGLFISKANIDRVQGASQLRNYLAWRDLPEGRSGPRVKIFETCPITFDALTRMEHDPDHLEDVLKVDAAEGDPMTGDDAYDMFRYALMSRPPISYPAEKFYNPGTDAHSAQMAEKIEKSTVDRLKKEQQMKDQVTVNWTTDQDMTPEWNRW